MATVEEKVRKDWEERGTWVNKECFYSVWERIWEWLRLDSIKDQMMKHRMVCDHDDLFWVGDSHTSPRDRADNLLRKIVPRCGEFGYYLLYMCIRDSTGNPLGHEDAVRELTTYAREKHLQPPWIVDVPVPAEQCTNGSSHPPHLPLQPLPLLQPPVVPMSTPDPVEPTSETKISGQLPLEEQGILYNLHVYERIEDREVEKIFSDKQIKFRKLVCKVYVHVEKAIGDTTLNDFKVFVTLCPHSWKRRGIMWERNDLKIIMHATNLAEIFIILNQYWDCVHYELLEIIVDQYGDQELKREMENYRQEIQELGPTTLNHFRGVHLCKYHPECVPVEAKIRGELKQFTIQQAHGCRYGLAQAYDLKPHAMRMSTVDTGSVIIVFLVPNVVSLLMLAQSNLKCDVFKELGVLRLTIGGRCVYDSEQEERAQQQARQLKSEVEGLRKEVKRLELENTSKHAELVGSKLKFSNTAKQLREHKTVLEELLVENVQLEEELKVKQEGSKEEGWWEVDARQLLKVDEKLTLEVGNLLERTGDGGLSYWALFMQEANVRLDIKVVSSLSLGEKLPVILNTWASAVDTVSIGMVCKACWKMGAHLAGDIVEKAAKNHVSHHEAVETQVSVDLSHYGDSEQDPESWLTTGRFSEQHNI